MTDKKIVNIYCYSIDQKEVKHDQNGFYFKVIERDQPEPYGHEVWGYLCDSYGYAYVYSLPIISTQYNDGYLDRKGDWIACFGGMGYDQLIIPESEMMKALRELGYVENNN